MQIRRAETADIPEFVRLKGVLMTTGWPFPVDLDEIPEWPQRCADVMAGILDDPDHLFLVVDHPDGPGPDGAPRLIAAISASIERHLPGPRGNGCAGYIGDMSTDPAYRGRGIGRQMLAAALAWLDEAGVGRTSLYATPSGESLYRAAGFEGMGENPFTYLQRRNPALAAAPRATSATPATTTGADC